MTDALRQFSGMIGLRQNLPRFIDEQPSGFRHPHLPLRAMKQRDAELLLELADPQAQRRLAEVQPFGRAAEMEEFSQGDRVAKMAKLHNPLIHGKS